MAPSKPADDTRLMVSQAAPIDEYLAALDPEPRAELERIRALVASIVPDTVESMSYGMPTLSSHERALVYFTVSKRHLSFYPSSWAFEELQDRLTSYKTTAHAVQCTLKSPLPDDLVEDLVRVHVREIEAGRR